MAKVNLNVVHKDAFLIENISFFYHFRLYETFGEDPRLASVLAAAYIKGHQGNDLKNRTKAATCMKHYIGYSGPFNGRDRSAAWIPEVMLREYYLPSFESGVSSGSITVMLNSADVNGLPGHANHHYITDILKGELKFEGFAVSDWQDIIRLHTRDKIAETPEDAVRIAVMAGVDMSMVPNDFSFFNHCVSVAKKDAAFNKKMDDAVYRILFVKDKVGLFEDPYPHEEDISAIGTQESKELNLVVARESIILGKNEKNMLPIKDKSRKLLVTGATGNLLHVLNSGWSYSWQGDNEQDFITNGEKKFTIYEAIKNINIGTVTYKEGANFTHLTDLTETIKEAEISDVIILCLGEDVYAETPGNIDNLMLSHSQITLATAMLDLNKPVVLVYVAGRPRIVTSIVERVNAAVFSFLPGNRGGEAIADVLFGNYNPSGKFPITYPRGPNGLITYDYKPLEDFNYNFGDNIPYVYDPLYPFGYGLSFTTFTYSDLKMNTNIVKPPNSVSGSVKVENSGSYEGQETVIIYLNDEYCQISRPNKQLKGFYKINLKPGESKVVDFNLTLNDMTFINSQNKRVYEAGKFNVYVANLTTSFVLEL